MCDLTVRGEADHCGPAPTKEGQNQTTKSGHNHTHQDSISSTCFLLTFVAIDRGLLLFGT